MKRGNNPKVVVVYLSTSTDTKAIFRVYPAVFNVNQNRSILNFRSLFLLRRAKNNSEGYGSKWSRTERRSEAETETRHVRALSGVIPPI